MSFIFICLCACVFMLFFFFISIWNFVLCEFFCKVKYFSYIGFNQTIVSQVIAAFWSLFHLSMENILWKGFEIKLNVIQWLSSKIFLSISLIFIFRRIKLFKCLRFTNTARKKKFWIFLNKIICATQCNHLSSYSSCH